MLGLLSPLCMRLCGITSGTLLLIYSFSSKNSILVTRGSSYLFRKEPSEQMHNNNNSGILFAAVFCLFDGMKVLLMS